MKKIIFLFVIISIFLNAEDRLIIDANKFEADDKKGLTLFIGNVKVTRVEDKLNSDRLEVYTIKNSMNENKKVRNEPTKYVAIGNVTFDIKSNGKEYEGKGDKVIYDPKELKYIIIGNGFLREKVEDKRLYGDKIYIDQNNGEARVEGSEDKPVRFIMKIEQKEKSENN